MPPRPCQTCKQQFKPRTNRQVFCSRDCRTAASIKRERIARNGGVDRPKSLVCGCGTTFPVPPLGMKPTKCRPCLAADGVRRVREYRERGKCLGRPATAPRPCRVKVVDAPVAVHCARCQHGRPSGVAELGFECGIERAGSCRPLTAAAFFRPREERA